MASKTLYFRERERNQMERIGMRPTLNSGALGDGCDGGCMHFRGESKATIIKVNGPLVTGTVPVLWQQLHYLEQAATSAGVIPALLIDFADDSVENYSGMSKEKTYVAFPIEYLDVLPSILADHLRRCMPEKK